MKLYALEAASGQVKWEFAAGGAMGSPTLGADGTVYVASSDSVLHALNGVTGQHDGVCLGRTVSMARVRIVLGRLCPGWNDRTGELGSRVSLQPV